MSEKSGNVGLGFTIFLTIIFIVLKLCKAITWSWIWVLSPIWILTALIVIPVIIFAVAMLASKGK